MKNTQFDQLLAKITSGSATEEEMLLYYRWYDKQLLKSLDEQELENAKRGVSEEIFNRLKPILDNNENQVNKSVKIRKYLLSKWWYVSAAAAILIIMFSVNYVRNQNPLHVVQKEYSKVNFVENQGVTLILGNGDKIDISAISSDKLNEFADKKIANKDGNIQYDLDLSDIKSDVSNTKEVVHNTLFTPAGKTYHIVLADGTKVWLNAKSMLRFPINFDGNERRVQLIGEGYFEVVTNASKPFIVESEGQELKVLGTKFNVEAYTDDSSVKSTLLEGKIAINAIALNKTLMLFPGEQAVIVGEKIVKRKVLLKNVLGWRSGVFVFDNDNLGDICHILSRWYNVEFDTTKNSKILNQLFSGTIPKHNTVDEVLSILSETEAIKYKREGRRIVFMN
ncbi:FecR family protein [Sphingobacterium bovisgrunnientis]|uniref:FecR family protein n=1 Tax=Sphingobacterium bovisgrunnientis TaxID=1874697 RepID=UPI00135B923D|nr:FecR domain-containing protein [Sphingobacterium bovisgrunnientis]